MTIDTQNKIGVAPPTGFAAGYSPHAGSRDEMVEPDGSLRPHWQLLVSQLDELGPDGIRRRWEQARRLIRENGITHNVYGDPNGVDRPWNLDFAPLLLTAAEWKQLSEKLAQRARVLDAVLADLHGPRRCISEGWLPPELLYTNPGFLRACHGVTPPGGRWLHLYAADMVRLSDGGFSVLCDRTQAPSGAGYCLENRIVLSSVLPSTFRQCNVHRLAPFFISLRNTLKALAPANRDNPRIVVLTPGPYNETYFEHAYLARYLGYTLVQGNDLTVRDGVVFLKTLGGLQRIDVILRRVDDDFCDPLELYQHSFLGVPGLVEAVRQGNVAVANALGSGLVQAPAMLAFLPGLCRNLLGEELQLPSAPTWWCGQDEAMRYVLDHLHELVIKPAYTGSDPQFGREMSTVQLSALREKIVSRPADYIAQSHVESSTAPVLTESKVEARRFVLRVYAVAENSSYAVMTGGLTRVTGAHESLVVSLQRGGGSKDTWIQSETPVNEPSLLSMASHGVELNRGGGELTSRVADDMFWLGRYVQRAEAHVRVARCLVSRLMDQGRADMSQVAIVLGKTLLGHSRFRLDEDGVHRLVSDLFSPSRDGVLQPSMKHVRNLVRGLRDRVSLDAWRTLQSIDAELAAFDANIEDEHLGQIVETLNRLMVGFLAFGGVVSESMTRGQAWRFLDIGARIERAIAMTTLVRTGLVQVMDDESSILDAMLEVADSSLTYRRRYFTQLEPAAVVDLLVADEDNPRAVAYQVAALEEHLSQLPREHTHPQRSPDRLTATKLRTQLKLAELRLICVPDARGYRPPLGQLMTEVTDAMGKISDWVSQIYFSHANTRWSLQGMSQSQ